jgi:hypothetical protein
MNNNLKKQLNISFNSNKFFYELKQIIVDDDEVCKFFPSLMVVNWKFLEKLCMRHFNEFLIYLSNNNIIITSENKNEHWIPVDEIITIIFPHYESTLDDENDIIDEVFPLYETMEEIFVRAVTYN